MMGVNESRFWFGLTGVVGELGTELCLLTALLAGSTEMLSFDLFFDENREKKDDIVFLDF